MIWSCHGGEISHSGLLGHNTILKSDIWVQNVSDKHTAIPWRFNPEDHYRNKIHFLGFSKNQTISKRNYCQTLITKVERYMQSIKRNSIYRTCSLLLYEMTSLHLVMILWCEDRTLSQPWLWRLLFSRI